METDMSNHNWPDLLIIMSAAIFRECQEHLNEDKFHIDINNQCLVSDYLKCGPYGIDKFNCLRES